MASVQWEKELAEVYDETSQRMFRAEVLEPTVAFLAELAADQPALELAIGTGRVALPLAATGCQVSGIELSPHMIDELKKKPGADQLEVTTGDMKETRVGGEFGLAYLVYNTIMNVTSQAEQVAVFANAAAHLSTGGHFVVEVMVPVPRPSDPTVQARMFTLESDHIGFETWEEGVDQITWSHHWMVVDGKLVRESAPFRYIWPSELDLMAQLAGLQLKERWSTWTREPFDSSSTSQIAVYQKVQVPGNHANRFASRTEGGS